MQTWLGMTVTVLGATERRHGNADHVNGSDDDGDDMKKPQDHTGVYHDGADAVTMPITHMNSGIFMRSILDQTTTRCLTMMTKNDIYIYMFLIQGESDVLAAVSLSNRTLAQARQAVKDARAERKPIHKISAAASARDSESGCFLRRGPHLTRDCPDGNKQNGKGKRGSGSVTGCDMVSVWLRHLQ